MKSKVENAQPCLEEILQTLEDSKFHGNVTIHYTNGQPRKIEYKKVEDLGDKKKTK